MMSAQNNSLIDGLTSIDDPRSFVEHMDRTGVAIQQGDDTIVWRVDDRAVKFEWRPSYLPLGMETERDMWDNDHFVPVLHWSEVHSSPCPDSMDVHADIHWMWCIQEWWPSVDDRDAFEEGSDEHALMCDRYRSYEDTYDHFECSEACRPDNLGIDPETGEVRPFDIYVPLFYCGKRSKSLNDEMCFSDSPEIAKMYATRGTSSSVVLKADLAIEAIDASSIWTPDDLIDQFDLNPSRPIYHYVDRYVEDMRDRGVQIVSYPDVHPEYRSFRCTRVLNPDLIEVKRWIDV